MENLKYTSKETQEYVEAIMASPSASGFTKQIIKEGLQKDCLDAVAYVRLALDALTKVNDDIMGK